MIYDPNPPPEKEPETKYNVEAMSQ